MSFDVLDIRIFGGEVSIRNRQVLLTPREFELLAFFALTTREVDGQTAAGNIWGECPDRHALNVFHVTLLRLRRKIGKEAVEHGPRGYRLARGVTSDVQRLERGVTQIRGGGGATIGEFTALAHAVAANVPIRLQSREWFEPSTVRLDALRATFFSELSRRWIDAGETETALAFAEKITRIDAEDERGYALAIRAYLTSGNELAAQRILRTWRRISGEPANSATDLRAFL